MSRLKLLKVLFPFTQKKKNNLHHISFTRTVLILISHWLPRKLSMASTVFFYFVLVSPCEPQDHYGSLSRPVPLGLADWLRTLGGWWRVFYSQGHPCSGTSGLRRCWVSKMFENSSWNTSAKLSLVLLNLESLSFIVLIVVEFAQDALWKKKVLINQTCNIRQM